MAMVEEGREMNAGLCTQDVDGTEAEGRNGIALVLGKVYECIYEARCEASN